MYIDTRMKNMTFRNRRAFTLMELLVTIVILGIMAGLAVPSYQRTIEQSRSNEAIVNLNIINMGQKIFATRNGGNYWVDDGTPTIAEVNAALSIDISARYYTTVDVSASNGTDPKTYTAVLTRNAVEGGASSKTFTSTFASTDTQLAPPVETGSY